MKKILFLFLLFRIACLGAQSSHTLSINIGNNLSIPIQSKAHLIGHFVNQKKIIDTISGGNRLVFKLNDTLPKGMYNVMLYSNLKDSEGKFQRMSFDVIVANEDIELTINITNTMSFADVQAKSGENFVYNNYFKEKTVIDKKIDVLEKAMSEYPPQDVLYSAMEKRVKELKNEQSAFFKFNCNNKKSPYACNYIQWLQKWEANSIDNIDFKAPLLKQSALIPLIVLNYLIEAEKDSLGVGTKSEKIVKRLDVLLPKLKADEQVGPRMLEDIIKFYETTGFNDIVVYLNEQYLLPNVCENVALSNSIKEKNQVLKKLVLGELAPNIIMNGLNGLGNVQELSTIQAQYSLLLFWETNCYHCQELTKELVSFYNQNKGKGFEVIAMALDTSKTNLTNYITNNNLNWLNYSDLKGWDGQAVKDYNVRATPSMFLLDNEKRIIAKPRSIEELKRLIVF